jgi:hypothetical protein
VRFLKIGHCTYYDLFKLVAEGSLDKVSKLLDVEGRTRKAVKKLTVPYTYFDSLDKLHSSDVPDFASPHWNGLGDGKKLLSSEEEHAALSETVARRGWSSIFTDYLRNVSAILSF